MFARAMQCYGVNKGKEEGSSLLLGRRSSSSAWGSVLGRESMVGGKGKVLQVGMGRSACKKREAKRR